MTFVMQVLTIAALLMLMLAVVKYFVGPDKKNKNALDIRLSIAGVVIFIACTLSLIVSA